MYELHFSHTDVACRDTGHRASDRHERADGRANETGLPSEFEEHRVKFHTQAVKLAGSLLLPRSEAPVPAVVFVHGAGQQTREPYREAGEYFARQGIAALIYDKRGTGQSGGTYESYGPLREPGQ